MHDGSRPSSGRLSSFSTAANSPPDNKIKKLSGRFSIKSADPSVDDDKFDAEGGSGSFSKTKDRPLRSTHKQPTGFVRRMTRRSVYYTQAIISRLTGGAIEEEDENEEKTDLEEGKTNESNDDDDGNAPVKVTLASDNSLLEGGEWRQRAIEDEKERRRQKQNSNLHAQKIIKTVNKVKKAKKVQKKDRKARIHVLLTFSTSIGNSEYCRFIIAPSCFLCPRRTLSLPTRRSMMLRRFITLIMITKAQSRKASSNSHLVRIISPIASTETSSYVLFPCLHGLLRARRALMPQRTTATFL